MKKYTQFLNHLLKKLKFQVNNKRLSTKNTFYELSEFYGPTESIRTIMTQHKMYKQKPEV